MRLRTRITFVEPWSILIDAAARQCGVSVDEYCRRAVQLTTKQGFEEGRSEPHDTASGVSTGNSDETRVSEGSDSSALPNETDSNSSSQT